MRKAFFSLLAIACALLSLWLVYRNVNSAFWRSSLAMSALFLVVASTTQATPDQTFIGQCKFCVLAGLVILVAVVAWHSGLIGWIGAHFGPIFIILVFGSLALMSGHKR